MTKEKVKKQIILSSLLATLFVVMLLFLNLTQILPLLTFFILVIIILFLLAGEILFMLLKLKANRKKEQALLAKIEQERIAKLKALYELLGIPVQYNADGSIKNLYQLLNIEKVVDKDGVRQLTSYELLKILPLFDEDFKEVPAVFVIKNRVKSVAKGIIEAPSFKFKPVSKNVVITAKAPQQKPKVTIKASGKTSAGQTYIKAPKPGKPIGITKLAGPPKKKDSKDKKADQKPVKQEPVKTSVIIEKKAPIKTEAKPQTTSKEQKPKKAINKATGEFVKTGGRVKPAKVGKMQVETVVSLKSICWQITNEKNMFIFEEKVMEK